MVRCQRNINISSFPDGLSVVKGFHLGQMFGIFINEISYLKQQFSPLLGGYRFPGFKCLLGGFVCTINVFRACICTRGKGSAVSRACGVKGFTGLGFNPFAVNI